MMRIYVYILPLVLLIAACEPAPRDIQFGQDECAFCQMRVSDRAFATQLVTTQGRNFIFDSVECLAAHVERGDVAAENIHSIWVANFADPEGEPVDAESAIYLQSETLSSPMGLALSAYPDRATAEQHRDEYEGTLHDWSEVREIVRNSNMISYHHHDLDDLEVTARH